MKSIPLLIILSFLLVGCLSTGDKPGCAELTNSSEGISLTQAIPVQAEGLPNLFKVSDDIYRSAQPEEGGMTSARALGIKTVVSLRATELDTELDRKEKTGLQLVHIPIVTGNVTDKNILDAMQVIRDAPKPILIHCRHGSDRTGLIVAMYRMIFQNWSKSCAKQEMISGGFGFHSIWLNIPREIDDADIESLRKTLFSEK